MDFLDVDIESHRQVRAARCHRLAGLQAESWELLTAQGALEGAVCGRWVCSPEKLLSVGNSRSTNAGRFV